MNRLIRTMVNGWIILDKPAGMTSTRAGSLVKRHLKVKKLGHAGTLDPFATGVLPLALGEATKTMPYVVDGSKAYQFEITWGEARSTEDIEGEVTETSPVRPSLEEIEHALPQFIGTIDQVPPIYSALKIGGMRACDLARQGQEVVMKKRQVTITDLKVIRHDSPDKTTFEVSCGAGTYVRSLGRDLAKTLGTCGHLSTLRRIKVGKFTLDWLISLDNFLDMSHNSIVESVILPIRAVLDDIPAVPVSETDLMRIRHGNAIECIVSFTNETQVVLKSGDEVIALAIYRDEKLHPHRVFNL